MFSAHCWSDVCVELMRYAQRDGHVLQDDGIIIVRGIVMDIRRLKDNGVLSVLGGKHAPPQPNGGRNLVA